MALIAKQITKNKFWVVEQDGEQIATIQTTPDGVSYVHDNRREKFVNLSLLKKKYNIVISKEPPKKKVTNKFEVSGFPCDCVPHNELFNVSKKLPIFTKSTSSKSFYCAGHYLIKFNLDYTSAFCPKLITLNRYEFLGPFATKQELKDALKQLKDKNNGNIA